MKIRIHQNSIRVRLSVSDLEKLSQNEDVVNTISFGEHQTLSFVLKSADVPEISAISMSNKVVIEIPTIAARNFVSGNEVGIEIRQPIDSTQFLHVLIEKDFDKKQDD